MIASARRIVLPLVLLSCAALAGCNGTIASIEPALSTESDEVAEGRTMIGKPYKVGGRWYRPEHDADYDKTGLASWYGPKFHGKRTANGERFNQNALTAAHPTLPLPSYVRVTVVKTGKSVVVRINDRGPFAKGRIIDVSKAAAEELNFRNAGHAKVRVEYLGPAPVGGSDKQTRIAAKKYSGKKPVKTAKAESGGLRKMLGFGETKAEQEESAKLVKVRMAVAEPRQHSNASALPGVSRRYIKEPEPEPASSTALAYSETEEASGAIDAVIALNEPAPEPEPIEAQPLPETASVADSTRVLGAFDMFSSDSGSGISQVLPPPSGAASQ